MPGPLDFAQLKDSNPTAYALLGGPFFEGALGLFPIPIRLPGLGGAQAAAFTGRFTQFAPTVSQTFGARTINVYKDGASTGVTTENTKVGFAGQVRNLGNTDITDVYLRMRAFSGSTQLRSTAKPAAGWTLPVGSELPISAPAVLDVFASDLPGDVTARLELVKWATDTVVAGLTSGLIANIEKVTAINVTGAASTGTSPTGVRLYYFTGKVENGGNIVRAFSIEKILVIGGVPYTDASNPPTSVTLNPFEWVALSFTFSQNAAPSSARGLVEVLINVKEAGVVVRAQKFSTGFTVVTEEKAEITGIFSF